MEPLTDLTNGLQILEPFLIRFGFALDNYENGKGSGGQFTIATYKREHKKFIIGYRFSIGELGYQFDDFRVGHSFYLDHLGYADKKQFPDFQSDDKLLAFRHILHDFEFLVEDFFIGSCDQLIEASRLQEKFIKEQNEKSQQEYNNHWVRIDIQEARQKFKEKDYKKCLEIYTMIERKNLLNDIDKKTIEYCKKHS